MEYVLTENGNIQAKDGKPVVKDGDQEYGIDAIGAQSKITALKKEAKDYRKKSSERGEQLKAFAGIEDPSAAIDALQTVSTMDDKHKADVEKLKGTINQAWQEKEKAWGTEKAQLENKLFDTAVTAKFATSPVVAKTIYPAAAAAKIYGDNLRGLATGDGAAVDNNGNTIYSKEKPGEPAGFDEALQHLIDTDPNKDQIWKGTGANGSGGRPGPGADQGEQPGSAIDKISAGLAARQAGR